MALFKDDPPIEQWFRDLFADLVETYPGMAGGKARLPKYWHSLCGFKPEALKRAFIRATEICEYFPSVPKILEIQAQGFGSQPFTSRNNCKQGRILTSEDIDLLKKKAGLRGIE